MIIRHNVALSYFKSYITSQLYASRYDKDNIL